MYVVNKGISLEEYLDDIKKSELNKLYTKYKKLFSEKILAKEEKKYIIITGIIHVFRNSLNTFNDKELEALENLLKMEKSESLSSGLIENNFLFIKNSEIIFPTEIKKILEDVNIKDISKSNKLVAIEFYLNINGLLSIDKLYELLEATDFYITKSELKTYLKELNLKVSKNYVYINEFAFNMDKENNLSKIKESTEDYAIYTLEDISKINNEHDKNDYIVKIYEILKNNFQDQRECFSVAVDIFDFIRCGYNLEENIQKVTDSKNLKGTKKEIKNFNRLLQEIYDNTPSWELNGYYPEEKEIKLSKKEIDSLLSYINMYMLMNGAIKIDKLLEILTNDHHFDISKEDLIEISQIPGDTYIINNCFCVEGVDGDILKSLIEQKEKIGKYKVVNNLENFFEEHDLVENKLKKLINKYTDNKEVVKQVISLIVFGGINEFTLDVTLRSNKVELSDNKKVRMLKDLNNCQKNVRTWSLNGFTMNEILTKKY